MASLIFSASICSAVARPSSPRAKFLAPRGISQGLDTATGLLSQLVNVAGDHPLLESQQLSIALPDDLSDGLQVQTTQGRILFDVAGLLEASHLMHTAGPIAEDEPN